MASILFVEDDELIASGLMYALEQEGHHIERCGDVASASAAIETHRYDLGLLDLSLPDGTGYDLCAALKDRGTPVIFLSAVDDEGNVVRGLELGADDYVTKPFRLRELMARINKVLSRHCGADEVQAVVRLPHGIEIHTAQAKVYRAGARIELTALEYRLLLTLANHRGQILSREQLLSGIWDVAGNFVSDNALTVYIKRLREKLGDDSQNPEIIRTVRGMGYRIDG